MGYDGYARFWLILRAVSIGYNLWTQNPEPGRAGIEDWRFVVSLQASPSATTRQVALSFLFKSIEYLNFRHFAILGISLGNLIVPQKDLAT